MRHRNYDKRHVWSKNLSGCLETSSFWSNYVANSQLDRNQKPFICIALKRFLLCCTVSRHDSNDARQTTEVFSGMMSIVVQIFHAKGPSDAQI